MAWGGTFGCWPFRLLSFYHRKVSFSLSGRVMLPGEVLFFPKLWNYWIYISSGTCAQSRYFWFFVIVATDVSLPGFMKQPFWFPVLLSLIVFSYNLCLSDTPYHPAPVSSCSLSPLFITFSVHSRRPQYSRLLSFSLPPRPSVRWENWPHKKWKGLFKRSSSVMKTYYCIPWCAARGGCCWPTAILFS